MTLGNEEIRIGFFAGPIQIAAAGAAVLVLCGGETAPRLPGSIQDELLGIRINSDLQSAERKLDALGSRQADTEEEKESDSGRTLAWQLKRTSYQRIGIRANADGKILWLTGTVRRGSEIPFARLGDLSIARRATDAEAIWYVATPDGGYRLIARGKKGKASLVSLLSLSIYAPKM